ncbi:MAG: hypothetical protein LQ345_004243 [Seirophora villosa]|nr:MAG: hypothetical protein LQ345_004243 [Seirophora villosa]
MDSDIENSHVSKLPRAERSRLPSPTKHVPFGEVTAASVNSRSGEMLPPPHDVTGKKRKTLAERGGEPHRKPQAPGVNRQANAGIKATTLAGTTRQPSYSSSVASSRPSSVASSRIVSNGSYTSTISTGSRPQSIQSYRAQSAAAASRIQRPQSVQGRSASSMEAHVSEHGPPAARGHGKSSGRTPFSSTLKQCPEKLEMIEGHASNETQPQMVLRWASSIPEDQSQRDASPSTSVDDLSLSPSRSQSEPKGAQKREVSLTTAMANMSLVATEYGKDFFPSYPATPSQIPKPMPRPTVSTPLPSPTKSPKKTPAPPKFINRHTNEPFAEAFDPDDRLTNITNMMSDFQKTLVNSTSETNGLKETITFLKEKVAELESIKTQLTFSNENLLSDLSVIKADLNASSIALEELKRQHSIHYEDLQRQQRRDLEDSQRQAQDEISQLERRHALHCDDLNRRLNLGLEEEKTRHHQELQRLQNASAKAQEEADARHQQELQALNHAGAKSKEEIETQLEQQSKKIETVENELRKARADAVCQQNLNHDLQIRMSEAASNAISLESSNRSLRAHVDFLESDNKSQSHAFSDLDNRLQNAIKAAEEAKEKLRTEETLRRKLHNQVQELKGNIRVFCRVRPSLASDPVDANARITYPDNDSDGKEVEICGLEEKNSLGKVSTKTNAFSFDRIFNPSSMNADIFGEISQLVQSALDGYNVCIFCYGQTGSGKTYTMSAQDGMIPRAVNQIYDTAKSLEEKGWKYTMEGSFVEVYNENLNDLLGKADELDKKKHEIRHDMQRCKTTITDITTVELDSPNKVESILQRASSNRSVAATKANERSSRSHSVFILKLTGENSTTGERSEGTLNLVDLAGSERLSQSQATGERLKETQSINKSLSCLGDVIGALGQGKDGGHIPYRNSKLTYLLQFSLGGNSKTLMFVMISPLQAHLSETLTSLKFATKVHNTHIGTAKRQAKVRDN